MLNITSAALRESGKFLKDHKATLNKQATYQVLACGERELVEQFKIPDHPVTDVLHHRALRDAYREGLQDMAHYFVHFVDDPVRQGEPDFEPLEPKQEDGQEL